VGHRVKKGFMLTEADEWGGLSSGGKSEGNPFCELRGVGMLRCNVKKKGSSEKKGDEPGAYPMRLEAGFGRVERRGWK